MKTSLVFYITFVQNVLIAEYYMATMLLSGLTETTH